MYINIFFSVSRRHCNPVPEETLRKVEQFLHFVVARSQEVYGNSSTRYVVHCLLHVRKFLSTNKIRSESATMWKYENGMKLFKHFKRSGARISAQLTSRLIERRDKHDLMPPL